MTEPLGPLDLERLALVLGDVVSEALLCDITGDREIVPEIETVTVRLTTIVREPVEAPDWLVDFEPVIEAVADLVREFAADIEADVEMLGKTETESVDQDDMDRLIAADTETERDTEGDGEIRADADTDRDAAGDTDGLECVDEVADSLVVLDRRPEPDSRFEAEIEELTDSDTVGLWEPSME